MILIEHEAFRFLEEFVPFWRQPEQSVILYILIQQLVDKGLPYHHIPETLILLLVYAKCLKLMVLV